MKHRDDLEAHLDSYAFYSAMESMEEITAIHGNQGHMPTLEHANFTSLVHGTEINQLVATPWEPPES